MPPTSTEWPWSSRACATSAIELRPQGSRAAAGLACSLAILFLLLSAVQASTIDAGSNIQAAIDSASAGDIILVSAGDYGSFLVDRPVTIMGEGEPCLYAGLQRPAIEVKSDGVAISGFRIKGVGKDTTAKFNYYMQNPAAAAGASLDDPNSAIVVKGGGHGGSGAPSRPHSPAPMSLTAPCPGPSVRLRTDQHEATGSQRYSASVITGTATSLSSPELLVGPARRLMSRSVAQSYCASSGSRR